MNTALEYREYLVRNGIPPPPLYTLNGEKIPSQSILDPGQGARLPERLEFIFGEQGAASILAEAEAG